MKIPTINYVYDRRHVANSDRKGNVDMVITYNRERKYISTGVQCLPHQWTGDRKGSVYVKGTGADVEMNQILLTMYQKAYKIISGMVESGNVDISAIPTLLKAQNVDMTFLDYIRKRMEERNVTEHTHRSYVTMYNKVSEFGKIRFFSDVTQKNIRDLSEWLHSYSWTEKDKFGKDVRKTYSQASIYKITSNLSVFISDAVVDGYLKENPYVSKRMNEDKGKTRIDEFLTAEQVRMIEDATMPTQSLSEARDLFLVQCYTGLAYVDLMSYDFTIHKGGKDKELCTGIRHKTGVEFHFVMTDKCRSLLKRYKYVLPKLPNQKYNVKLKMVADAAKLDISLTSHMGRRTAGSLWLNSGIPMEVVSKCLGHSSVSMTQRAYAKVLDKTIIEAFKKL
jgi:integrase